MIPIIEKPENKRPSVGSLVSTQELVDMISSLPSGAYLLCIEENQALKRAAAKVRKELLQYGSYTHDPRSTRIAKKG